MKISIGANEELRGMKPRNLEREANFQKEFSGVRPMTPSKALKKVSPKAR